MAPAVGSLTKAQKAAAIVSACVAVLTGILALGTSYVTSKTDQAVGPLRAELNGHVNAPGHEEEFKILQQMQRDQQQIAAQLAYIQGQTDAHWGSLDDKRNQKEKAARADTKQPKPVPVSAGE